MSNSNPSSATPAAIDIRTTLINIIERDVPEIQYVTENRAENLVDEFLEALAAAAETVIGEDDQYQTWSEQYHRFLIHREELVDDRNDLRAEQRKRLAEMVGNSKEGESDE